MSPAMEKATRTPADTEAPFYGIQRISATWDRQRPCILCWTWSGTSRSYLWHRSKSSTPPACNIPDSRICDGYSTRDECRCCQTLFRCPGGGRGCRARQTCMCGNRRHGEDGMAVPRVCGPLMPQASKDASASAGQLELGRATTSQVPESQHGYTQPPWLRQTCHAHGPS